MVWDQFITQFQENLVVSGIFVLLLCIVIYLLVKQLIRVALIGVLIAGFLFWASAGTPLPDGTGAFKSFLHDAYSATQTNVIQLKNRILTALKEDIKKTLKQ